jgi:hypothetical protein
MNKTARLVTFIAIEHLPVITFRFIGICESGTNILKLLSGNAAPGVLSVPRQMLTVEVIPVSP